MLRTLARINGDTAGRTAGNDYSQHNRARTQRRLDEMRDQGIVPMCPKDEEKLRKQEAKPYTTISQRAVRVPRVGIAAAPERKPLVDCLPHRRAEDEIRAAEHDFARPRAPAGAAYASSDAKKDELAMRNQFFGKTPQEILAEGPPRPSKQAPAGPTLSEEQTLHNQIADEIAERQSFLDNMTALGQGHLHRERIEGEISERVRDLNTLARLQNDA